MATHLIWLAQLSCLGVQTGSWISHLRAQRATMPASHDPDPYDLHAQARRRLFCVLRLCWG